MKESNSKITIITVSYNAVTSIEPTILSVINQTYPNIEYIVIDGGSNDGTVDIIKKYQNKISYWVSEPDKGIYDAMNKGIRMATGDWINFMNAGDTFFCDTSLNLLFIPEPDSGIDIIYGDTEFIYAFGRYVRQPAELEKLKYGMIFCHQSSFVKADLLKKQNYNTKYKICADYDFFYSCLKERKTFQYIPHTISVFDARNGLSSVNRIAREREFGIISGRSHTPQWKLEYYKFIISHQIKGIIKQSLPENLLFKIRRWNFKRITKAVNQAHEYHY